MMYPIQFRANGSEFISYSDYGIIFIVNSILYICKFQRPASTLKKRKNYIAADCLMSQHDATSVYISQLQRHTKSYEAVGYVHDILLDCKLNIVFLLCFRDRKAIAARIAAREEKKCIVEEPPRDQPDETSEYIQQTQVNGSRAQTYGPQANGAGPPVANGNGVGNTANGHSAPPPEYKDAVRIECEVHKTPDPDGMKLEEVEEPQVAEGADAVQHSQE